MIRVTIKSIVLIGTLFEIFLILLIFNGHLGFLNSVSDLFD